MTVLPDRHLAPCLLRGEPHGENLFQFVMSVPFRVWYGAGCLQLYFFFLWRVVYVRETGRRSAVRKLGGGRRRRYLLGRTSENSEAVVDADICWEGQLGIETG